MKKIILITFCLCSFFVGQTQTLDKIIAKDAKEIVNNRNTVCSVLIDGRSAEMFSEKHIQGAININAFESSLMSELKNLLNNKEIIVYCSNSHRSEIIIENLLKLDYKGKIIFIEDGINGWISAGYKTVSI